MYPSHIPQEWTQDPFFTRRYKPPVPFGKGPYVGKKIKRKEKNLPPMTPELWDKIYQMRSKKTYTIPEAAGCVHGVGSRRIWNAVISCLVREENLRLGPATRLASPIYHYILRRASSENWSDAQIAQEILNQTQLVGSAMKQLATEETKRTKKSQRRQGSGGYYGNRSVEDFIRYVTTNAIDKDLAASLNDAEGVLKSREAAKVTKDEVRQLSDSLTSAMSLNVLEGLLKFFPVFEERSKPFRQTGQIRIIQPT